MVPLIIGLVIMANIITMIRSCHASAWIIIIICGSMNAIAIKFIIIPCI